MHETEWELFFRTGLPQAYSFAKAVERGSETKRTGGKIDVRDQKEIWR